MEKGKYKKLSNLFLSQNPIIITNIEKSIKENLDKLRDSYNKIITKYDYTVDIEKELTIAKDELENIYVDFIEDTLTYNKHYKSDFRCQEIDFCSKVLKFIYDKQENFEKIAMRNESEIHIYQRQIMAITKVGEKIEQADIHNVGALDGIKEEIKRLNYNVRQLNPDNKYF